MIDEIYPDASVNIPMPKSWSELSDSQMMFCYGLKAAGKTNMEVQTHCLLKWGRIKVHRSCPEEEGFHVSIPFRRRKDGPLQTLGRMKPRLHLILTPDETYDMAMNLSWINDLPERPVRPGKVRHRNVLNPMLDGLTFETYLVIDNHLQGWLHTENPEHLHKISEILFPMKLSWRLLRIFRLRRKGLDALDIASLQWVASLKLALSRLYPNILKRKDEDERKGPSFGAGALGLLSESVNAQLRALTKGDITKEKEVRLMPYRRALTELDALARESDELRQKLKNK